jgi:hypothetical protein
VLLTKQNGMPMLVCVCGQVLLEAGIKTADAVVLGSGPPAGNELEADARILAAVLQVRGHAQPS